MTDRRGLLIRDAFIDPRTHTLQGKIRDRISYEPADWSAATLIGQAHCTSLRHRNQVVDVKVRIREVSSKRIGGANVQTYHVELEDRGRVMNACRDPDDVALAVNGYWDETGAHVIDGNSFSLACTERDIATCLDAGYVDDPGDPTSYALFKACTRMLRADYCGNGTSHTADGTFVTIYDNRKIVADDQLPPLVFEAAWSSKGAFCMARPRWANKAPICPTPIPECPPDMSRDTARSLADVPLVFNESCVDHPCTVMRPEFDETRVPRTTILKQGAVHPRREPDQVDARSPSSP